MAKVNFNFSFACFAFDGNSITISFVFFCADVVRTEGKRRRAPRSVEQCEREIQRLQSSLDTLRSQIGDENSDMGGRDSNDEMLALPPHSDIKMRNIISKYVATIYSIILYYCLQF